MNQIDVFLHSKLGNKQLKVRKLFILFIITGFIHACKDDVVEVKENVFSARDHSLVENEFNSTVEAMSDWIGNAKFYKKGETIIPENVKVSFLDSTFKDMDGVEGTLDFGVPGTTKPYGLLCSDGKYRSGKIHFKCNQPLNIPGGELFLVMNEADSFSSGPGDEIYKIKGVFRIHNPDGLHLRLQTDNLLLENKTGTIEWSCDRTLKLVKDAGQGIWGDIYSIEGTSSGVDRHGEAYSVEITEALIKKMEVGCSRTFIKGRLTIRNHSTNKDTHINYDPENNSACDQLIEAEINGKKTLFLLK